MNELYRDVNIVCDNKLCMIFGGVYFMSETKSEKQITYDFYFKIWVIEYWLAHPELSSDQISDIFHVDRENVKKWRKIYLDQGEDAFK